MAEHERAAEVRAVAADIPMGMTQVEDGDAKVLFVRDEHGLRAFQATCPHYGAPLAKGKICGTTLYCPWHKAAFDIGDGALIEPPALAGLAQYPIRTEGETVVATLTRMPASSPSTRAHDQRSVLVVGTGAAAVAAVTTLRHEGFGGRITMVGREDGEPYDRPKLSKNFLAKKTEPSTMAIEADFYGSRDIAFVKGPATRIDPATRDVTLADGTRLTADALLIATGSRAVVPTFAGGDLAGIHTLRSLADAVALSEAAERTTSIVVIGGGFIGLEAAAFLTKRGLAATIVSPEALPLAAKFGDEVAHAIKVYHEGSGVRFMRGKVAGFEGDAAVSGVRLESGETIATSLVLIGAGAAPETESIVGVAKRDDGGIVVDPHLKVADHVWVAGDIAAFPESHSGETARIEHWRLAEQQGAYAARAMLGAAQPFKAAPFFWSNQGDKRLDYAGYAPSWDEVLIKGDVATLDFIAYYVREGRAEAACAIGQNPQMIAFLHLLGEGRLPAADTIAEADLAAMV
jgi:NADPH-dependent 2,4-dienoyl-CoA reductase/sulfur reductase-like enzyme/nitrite reductase/ring-hydroxylating ferredoxin subunit